MGRSGQPVGAVWSRLTERDRRTLHLVADHRVLTTDQLTALEFGSTTRAQHRLQELHQLDVLWRFRFPRAAGGSYPWHYALGYTGARLIAAQKAVRPPRPAEHQQQFERLVESPKLRHQLGVNDFFTSLAAYARRVGWPEANVRGGNGLDTWRSEQSITDYHNHLVRPDGFGCWAEAGRLTLFYLEYDTGTEPLDRVAAKLHDYHTIRTRHAYLNFGVVLFTVATTRRETGLRTALARTLPHLDGGLPVATTARDYGNPDGPAGPVWAPLTRQPDTVRRVRLPDLVQTPEPTEADAAAQPQAAQLLAGSDPSSGSLTDWFLDNETTDYINLDPEPDTTATRPPWH